MPPSHRHNKHHSMEAVKERLVVMKDNSEWYVTVHPFHTQFGATICGRIVNLKTKKFMRSHKSEGGYMRLRCNKIHVLRGRFMLEVFVEQCPNGMTCDHINRIKTDDRLSNLRWATTSQQAQNKDLSRGQPGKYKPMTVTQSDGTVTQYNNITSMLSAIKPEYLQLTTASWNYYNKCKKNTDGSKSIWGYHVTATKQNHGTFRLIAPKYIKGASGYSVSENGFVSGKRMITAGVLKDGYRLVKIEGMGYRVHRLVAQMWIENPENKSMVNHIDGNKQNNRLTNLEWVTPAENSQHAIDCGLKSTKAVSQLTSDGSVVRTFNSVSLAHKYHGVVGKSGLIYECLAGKKYEAFGFKWMTVEELESVGFENSKKVLKDKPIIQMTLANKSVAEYRNAEWASVVLNKSSSHCINKCVNKFTDTAYGFRWCYK